MQTEASFHGPAERGNSEAKVTRGGPEARLPAPSPGSPGARTGVKPVGKVKPAGSRARSRGDRRGTRAQHGDGPAAPLRRVRFCLSVRPRSRASAAGHSGDSPNGQEAGRPASLVLAATRSVLPLKRSSTGLSAWTSGAGPITMCLSLVSSAVSFSAIVLGSGCTHRPHLVPAACRVHRPNGHLVRVARPTRSGSLVCDYALCGYLLSSVFR